MIGAIPDYLHRVLVCVEGVHQDKRHIGIVPLKYSSKCVIDLWSFFLNTNKLVFKKRIGEDKKIKDERGYFLLRYSICCTVRSRKVRSFLTCIELVIIRSTNI